MTTAQHRKTIDKLTTEFMNLTHERSDLERVHGAFQSAFKNPYSDNMKNLNHRWEICLTKISNACQAAITDGTRGKTVSRWLDCVGSWNAIQEIQRWDCEQWRQF